MGRLSDVMLQNTFFKISGHSQIALALRRNTLEKIDIKHGWASFAEASEGILLRAIEPCKSCEAQRREAG
jgi:hypothetical protein